LYGDSSVNNFVLMRCSCLWDETASDLDRWISRGGRRIGHCCHSTSLP
jgi:hypothetical protein